MSHRRVTYRPSVNSRATHLGESSGGISGRIAAATTSWKLGWKIRLARRAERITLRDFGDALAASSAVGRLVDDVRSRGYAEEHVRTAIRASLEEDRADFASASLWVRPIVILRGLAARAVLRDRLRGMRRIRDQACERLGKAALDGSIAMAKERFVPAPLARAREARAQVSALVTDRAALLAPFGGSAIPAVFLLPGKGAAALATLLVRGLRNQVLPRVPVLAVMAAGWWVASSFTESDLAGSMYAWAIEHGPAWVLRAETLPAADLWIPIGAAVTCGYLGHRFATRLHARYGLDAPP
jgi:hypothetical protein